MKLSESKHTHAFIKLILMGFTGTGKSTALIPLAIPNIVPDFPGYRLRVLDSDRKFEEVARNNLELRLNKTLAHKKRVTPISKEQYDIAQNNIEFEVIKEKTKMTKHGLAVIGSPRAWEKTDKILETWRKDNDSNTIVILDSWTHMLRVPVIAWCMALQGKELYDFGQLKAGHDPRRDYMCPQGMAKALMTDLANLNSHAIVCSHQSPVDMKIKTGEHDSKGNMIEAVAHSEMAMISVGSAGRIELPSEFNHTLVAVADPEGNRKISTRVEDGVTTKTPFFATAEKSYSLNDGLAQYWMLGRS